MPTYDYVCDKCGHEFELFQKMSDPPRRRCPRCRGTIRRRIGAGSGLLFKGSGFYATDYRSSEYKTKAKEESSGPKVAPPSESKPEGGKGAASRKEEGRSGPVKKE
jgi:putative FmdB family regulatory protein